MHRKHEGKNALNRLSSSKSYAQRKSCMHETHQDNILVQLSDVRAGTVSEVTPCYWFLPNNETIHNTAKVTAAFIAALRCYSQSVSYGSSFYDLTFKDYSKFLMSFKCLPVMTAAFWLGYTCSVLPPWSTNTKPAWVKAFSEEHIENRPIYISRVKHEYNSKKPNSCFHMWRQQFRTHADQQQ